MYEPHRNPRIAPIKKETKCHRIVLLHFWDERIISLHYVGRSASCFCYTCGDLSSRWARTYPLRTLHSRATEPLSGSACKLQRSAQGTRLRMLLRLRSGQGRILRRVHGILRHRPSLHSQTRRPKTSPLTNQGTRRLHRVGWGWRCDCLYSP